MPTWWIVGVAVYVPLFIAGVAHGVKEGDYELWSAVWGGLLFLAVSTASAVFWFG